MLAVGDGRAAVDLFSARAFDIDAVLRGKTLPGVSGLEVFEEVRRLKADAKVILTGTCDGERVNITATGAGQFPQGFILKPYRLLEVMRTLQFALYEGNSKFPMELRITSS